MHTACARARALFCSGGLCSATCLLLLVFLHFAFACLRLLSRLHCDLWVAALWLVVEAAATFWLQGSGCWTLPLCDALLFCFCLCWLLAVGAVPHLAPKVCACIVAVVVLLLVPFSLLRACCGMFWGFCFAYSETLFLLCVKYLSGHVGRVTDSHGMVYVRPLLCGAWLCETSWA